MPKETLAKLKKVRVRNRPLEITLDQGGPRGGDDFPGRGKPKRDFGPRDGGYKDGGRDKPRFNDRDNASKKSGYRPKKSD